MARNWMITGVSSGFGKALAAAALARGDTVVGTVRKDQDQAAFIEIAPGRSIALKLDVTDEAAVHGAVAEAETKTGGIDVLVINAGYGLVGGVEEATLAEVRAQFEVNVFGALATAQAALPFMRARRAGRILVITSVSGLVGWPSLGIYTGSKFALEGIVETMAAEVAPLGIKVTMVEPGGFRTEFSGGSRIKSPRIIEDYDETVGQNRRITTEHQGHEPGDPAKAAKIMLSIAVSDKPPLRLLLGNDAVGYVEYKYKAQMEEMAEWLSVSKSTDYDPA